MTTWIALFRGINVGGHNKLPMAELRAALESMGLDDVQTYIQSGNVVFRGAGKDRQVFEDEIPSRIETSHGFRPTVLVLEAEELRAAMEANPFAAAGDEPQSVHLYFLAARPENPDVGSLDRIGTATERFHLEDRVLYLHTPEGYGTSRLASSIERYLGVDATARNWRTVTKLLELAED